jgi:hypothetical protein
MGPQLAVLGMTVLTRSYNGSAMWSQSWIRNTEFGIVQSLLQLATGWTVRGSNPQNVKTALRPTQPLI